MGSANSYQGSIQSISFEGAESQLKSDVVAKSDDWTQSVSQAVLNEEVLSKRQLTVVTGSFVGVKVHAMVGR